MRLGITAARHVCHRLTCCAACLCPQTPSTPPRDTPTHQQRPLTGKSWLLRCAPRAYDHYHETTPHLPCSHCWRPAGWRSPPQDLPRRRLQLRWRACRRSWQSHQRRPCHQRGRRWSTGTVPTLTVVMTLLLGRDGATQCCPMGVVVVMWWWIHSTAAQPMCRYHGHAKQRTNPRCVF